ncbi:MAG: hypothetical protein JW941_10290 [Candidatus Coatesbacteria bacterium]|nr:hypothetical protein [Candidatus Coatesbacteria bacterium]
MSRSTLLWLSIGLTLAIVIYASIGFAEQNDNLWWEITHDRGLMGSYEYKNGDHMYIYISLYDYLRPFNADVYIGVIDTNGQVWSMDWDAWKKGNYPYYRNAFIPLNFYYPPTAVAEIVFPLTHPLPLGTYWLGMAVVEVGQNMKQEDVSFNYFLLVE